MDLNQMAQMVGQAPEQIGKYLQGIQFPIAKDELIQKLREHLAPQEILGLLERSGTGIFHSAQQVIDEVRRVFGG